MKKKTYLLVMLLTIVAIVTILKLKSNVDKVGDEDGSVKIINRSEDSLNNIKKIEDFTSLSHEDSYSELLETLGIPVVDVNSGIPFLIYEVFDTESENKTIMLRLSFDMNSKLSKIEQVNQDGEVVKTILDMK